MDTNSQSLQSTFKKFQEWGEVNVKEHSLNVMQFLAMIFAFSLMGFALGAAGELVTRWLQGDTVENKWKCGGFAIFQIGLVGLILFVLVSWNRYFDDWLLSTFAGMFFALMLLNTQERLSDNIKCILP